MKTPTLTLADALDLLSQQIESPDGVPEAAIAEAAERLREFHGAALGYKNAKGRHNTQLACDRIQELVD